MMEASLQPYKMRPPLPVIDPSTFSKLFASKNMFLETVIKASYFLKELNLHFDIKSQEILRRIDSLLSLANDMYPLDSFPAFHGTHRFITAFTRALHLSLS
jgi:hypothetical protein